MNASYVYRMKKNMYYHHQIQGIPGNPVGIPTKTSAELEGDSLRRIL